MPRPLACAALLFLAAPALARHAVLPEGEPALEDWSKSDWTVDSMSSASLYSPMDTSMLFATMRSPTTQLVVFSPDRMPIDRNKLADKFFNKSIYKLQLVQRACNMASGSTAPDTCYKEPFDYERPMSPDRVFELYRYGGTGGLHQNEVTMMEAISDMENGTSLERQWALRGFRGCEQIENTCNNHRAVSMKYGHPRTLRRFKNYDWSSVFYNDAEFMESVIFADKNDNVPNYTANFLESWEEECVHLKGDCMWTPSSTEYIQEVLPIAKGFDAARKREGQWLGEYTNSKPVGAFMKYLFDMSLGVLPKVKIVFTASGDVADYPKNESNRWSATLKRNLSDLADVPMQGVSVKVAAASVKVTAEVVVESVEAATKLQLDLADFADEAMTSKLLGFDVVTLPTFQTIMPPTPSSTPAISTGGEAASGEAASGQASSGEASSGTSTGEASRGEGGGGGRGSAAGSGDAHLTDNLP